MSMKMLQEIIDSGVKLTPMMVQYASIKKEYQDILLLFRMGDFYEVFFDDAIEASKILNITLTHRGKLGEHRIPMAGIPHHAASNYIDRITNAGLKAAICEQIEDPKEAVGVVKRKVTQVVSPGIPYDLEKTQNNEHRYIGVANYKKSKFHLAFLDFVTGDFIGFILQSVDELIEKIQLYSPKEFLTYLGQWEDLPEIEEHLNSLEILQTKLSQDTFEEKMGSIYIEKIIPSYKRDRILQANAEILPPIAALSYYVCSTQSLDGLCHIRPFRMANTENQMKITLPTLKGLEIFPKSRENYKDSLIGFVDKTMTSMGKRELKNFFLNPVMDNDEILKRQQCIQLFLDNPVELENTRDRLSQIRDLERIMAKTSTKKVTAQDFVALQNGIDTYFDLVEDLDRFKLDLFPKLKKNEIDDLKTVSYKIEKTINPEIGASLDKGNLIKEKASKTRDRLWKLSTNAENEVNKLEANYKKSTAISKLRIKYNNVIGYFIEVSKGSSNKVPKDFERRQTLVNSERYITKPLKEFETEVIAAQEKLRRLEKELFEDIAKNVINISKTIIKMSKALGLLDIFQGLSWIAKIEKFTCPIIDPKRKTIQLEGVWHPLLSSKIKEQFIPHTITLDENQFFGLITGPNMAGKTTVMREVAITQFLAQIGSFVPAKKATLGICNYLFSRLGANDDILKGQSTFMVEMTEAAEILRHANDKSLIILDEIGRGTSTYDGLSIAWALVEHLIKKKKSLTLFATHYHELIDVIEKLPQGKNFTVETFVQEGDVEFLYNLIEEGATQSFGIYVAKLAGFPKEVLNRAKKILQGLEEENEKSAQKDSPPSLFPEITEKTVEIPTYLKNMECEISKINVMNMTPIEALQKLNDLQEKIHLQ